MIGSSGYAVCGLHRVGGDEERGFLGWASKSRSTICQWFSLKTIGMVYQWKNWFLHLIGAVLHADFLVLDLAEAFFVSAARRFLLPRGTTCWPTWSARSWTCLGQAQVPALVLLGTLFFPASPDLFSTPRSAKAPGSALPLAHFLSGARRDFGSRSCSVPRPFCAAVLHVASLDSFLFACQAPGLVFYCQSILSLQLSILFLTTGWKAWVFPNSCSAFVVVSITHPQGVR
jgi:hypothetical protein